MGLGDDNCRGFALTKHANYAGLMHKETQSWMRRALTAFVIGAGLMAVLYTAALSSAAGVALTHPESSDVERAFELTLERGLVGYTGG